MKCPNLPLIDYSEFNKDFFPKIYSERIPLVGGLECTFRCNLNCVHCYVPKGKDNQELSKKELTYQQICRILDQVVDEGCLWFLLTGGEPFIRDDVLEIYEYAKRKGLIVTLFTNGTLINRRIVDFFCDMPPFLIEISMYGATKETYEYVTGIKGSFEMYRRGIDLLLEHNIPLQLKALVLKSNKHELWDMKAQAKSYNVEFRFDGVINPRLDGSLNPCDERISPEEMVELDTLDQARFEEWQRFAKEYQGLSKTDYFYHCGAGINCFHITPYGQLCLCLLARYPQYNLLEGTFKQGWREFLQKARFQKAPPDYRCGECEMLSLCGYCPGWYQLEKMQTKKLGQYMCRIAQLRAKHFLGDLTFNFEKERGETYVGAKRL